MPELREALETMTQAVTAVSTAKTSPKIRLALVTINDAIREIAAVLPAPQTVPIESDEPAKEPQ